MLRRAPRTLTWCCRRTPGAPPLTSASVRRTWTSLVPPGVAAQIDFDGGVSSMDIDESRFPKQDNGQYVSPDFSNAANRVTIKIEAGVSDITIR